MSVFVMCAAAGSVPFDVVILSVKRVCTAAVKRRDNVKKCI